VRRWWLPLILLLAVAVLQVAGALPDFSSGDARNTPPEVHCTKVLRPGADVSRALSAARGGATICLGKGDYGPIELDGVKKSPALTVRSAPGGRARVRGAELIDCSGLRLVAMRLTAGIGVSPSASRIEIVGNEISGNNGIYMFGDYRIGKRIEDVLIADNEIHDIDYSGTQLPGYGYGIEGIGDVRHVVIRGNTIQSTASDYIQSASPVHWVVDRNIFLGPSLLRDHADHQDLWQIFGGGRNITFTNNVARNTQTQESLLFQEGAFRKVRIENNLFDHDSRGYTCQLYQSSGLVFSHNTVVGSRWGCLFRDLAGSPPGNRYRVVRNVFADTQEGGDVSTEGRAANWGTYDYNVSSDGSAGGSHSLRRWHPNWADDRAYAARGLPFAAGYEAP